MAPLSEFGFRSDRPVIGMLHLPPLPGAPRYSGDPREAARVIQRDIGGLLDGGADGVLLENFGDAPFYPRRVPAHVVATMTMLAAELRSGDALPLGINVLRNDGRAALAIAHSVGAQFIRVNVLCGARVTDQGIIEGMAHKLLRDRQRLGAKSVKILADVDVKHSAALAPRSIEEEVEELLTRGGADGVIVSGPATGKQPEIDVLRRVRDAAGEHPVLVGSGVTVESIARFGALADGWIVGTSVKQDGRVNEPVDIRRVQEVVQAARSIKPGG